MHWIAHYSISDGSKHWFISLPSCKVPCKHSDINGEYDIANPGASQHCPIQRNLKTYYSLLHQARFATIIDCAVAFGIATFYAQTMFLPENLFVQMLPNLHPLLELAVKNRKLCGGKTVWGNGRLFDWNICWCETSWYRRPYDSDELSTLKLDSDFDPSTKESLTYLLGFFDNLFSKPFAYRPNSSYVWV